MDRFYGLLVLALSLSCTYCDDPTACEITFAGCLPDSDLPVNLATGDPLDLTETQWTDRCVSFADGVDCVEAIADCDELASKVELVEDLYTTVCEDVTYAEYNERASCMWYDGTVNVITVAACVDFGDEPECSELQTALDCAVSLWTEGCGADAAQWQGEFYIDAAELQYGLNCDLSVDAGAGVRMAAAILVTSLVFITVLLNY